MQLLRSILHWRMEESQFQSAIEKGQCENRCEVVSECLWHKLQVDGNWKPLAARFSSVEILLWNNLHTMKDFEGGYSCIPDALGPRQHRTGMIKERISIFKSQISRLWKLPYKLIIFWPRWNGNLIKNSREIRK
jgi:hypothetical protein